MEITKLQHDLHQLVQFQKELSNNISHLTCPMGGGMCLGSDLAVRSLREQMQVCEDRINNIKKLLSK